MDAFWILDLNTSGFPGKTSKVLNMLNGISELGFRILPITHRVALVPNAVYRLSSPSFAPWRLCVKPFSQPAAATGPGSRQGAKAQRKHLHPPDAFGVPVHNGTPHKCICSFQSRAQGDFGIGISDLPPLAISLPFAKGGRARHMVCRPPTAPARQSANVQSKIANPKSARIYSLSQLSTRRAIRQLQSAPI